MRTGLVLWIAPLLAVLTQSASAAEFPGIAVVELFTSEGCSSCPPADQLLKRIAETQTKSGHAIYCIGWHVDYWDRLGWSDRFAHAKYTARQRHYGNELELSAIYTPQMIVNGRDEFVGSNWKLADTAIGNALKTPVRHQVTLKCQVNTTDKTCQVTYTVSPAAQNAELQLVLVESGLSSKVTAGENRGETLTHVNAVRNWTTISRGPISQGTATLSLPKDWQRSRSQIIGFVQGTETLAITGAAAVSLAP
ncbi:DUF1223 domain-containing protein [bacterium]|nr:DUF1223 domain-containing protein [bacterium]